MLKYVKHCFEHMIWHSSQLVGIRHYLSMYWYVQVCTALYQVRTDIHQVDLYGYIAVCTSIY